MPQFNSLISRGLRQSQLAAISAPGSIAARSNPMRYGSILSRQFPGAFDPSTVRNNDILERQNKIDSGLQDQMYTLNNSGGLQRMQLDRNVDNQIYRAQRLQAAGVRRPLQKKPLPGEADPALYDTQFDYGEDNGI